MRFRLFVVFLFQLLISIINGIRESERLKNLLYTFYAILLLNFL